MPSSSGNLTANSTLPRSGLFPQPTANSTSNSTLPRSGLFPLPTVNLTTNFNASVSGRLPPPILNITASGRLPLASVNATGRPTYLTGFYPLPTLNGTNRTLPTSGDPPNPTGVFFPVSGFLPVQTLNVTRSVTPVSFANTSTTTSFLPVGTQISESGCPSIDGTVYTVPNEAGDRYQLQCAVQYSDRTFPDLDQPDLEGCIEQCSNIDAELSEESCQGISFLQYSSGGRCVLLGQSALTQSSVNRLAISAVLLAQGEEPAIRA